MAFAGQSFSVGQVLTAAQMNTVDSNIDAVRIHHKGSSQPAELAAGVMWLDDSSTPWSLKVYDGAAFIEILTIDPSGDTVSIDADTLDSLNSTQFLRSDANDTTTGRITSQRSLPGFILDDADAAADEGVWYFVSNTGVLQLQTRTDAGVFGENVYSVDRTGTTVDTIDFENGVLKSGGTNLLKDPGTSSDPALAFDAWRTPNANRPTLVEIEILAETNGTSNGEVFVDVDESGGTTLDYALEVRADADGANGFAVVQTVTAMIPAGGSYRIRNANDPNSSNAVDAHREFTL